MDTSKLRSVMKEKQISVQELAVFIGVSVSTLYKRLAGKTEFTKREIESICKIFHISSPEHIFFTKKV